MKKILACDYDRTFYLDDIDIEKNKKAVHKFIYKNNIFTVATGRSYLDFKNKVNMYKIKYNYAIINHGATIIDSNDNIIYNCEINNNIILDIKKNLELEKTNNYFCCSVLDSRVEFEHTKITKINAVYKLKEDAIKINKIINEKYSSYVNCYLISEKSIEIISQETNKSKAIKKLADFINIPTNNIYTIGDGYSNIKMIIDFNGYCMENSVKELKQLATSYKSVSLLIEDILNEKL